MMRWAALHTHLSFMTFLLSTHQKQRSRMTIGWTPQLWVKVNPLSLASLRDLVTITKDKQRKQNITPINRMIILIIIKVIAVVKYAAKTLKKKVQYCRFPTNTRWCHSVSYPVWFLEQKSTIHVFLVANSLTEHKWLPKVTQLWWGRRFLLFSLSHLAYILYSPSSCCRCLMPACPLGIS